MIKKESMMLKSLKDNKEIRILQADNRMHTSVDWVHKREDIQSTTIRGL
jgi:hypothetical protein